MTGALILLVTISACWTSAQPVAPIENTETGSAAPVAKAPPKPRSPIDDVIDKYEAWTRQMCACSSGDLACAKRITDEQIAWGEEMAKRADRNEQLDSDAAERAAVRMRPIMDEFTKCAMNAMTSPNPPATPNPPPP